MSTEPNKIDEIRIEADAEARLILQDDMATLARELGKASPGVEITHTGTPGGSKDAALIITAVGGLVAAATPIITQVISGFFATRGIKVELKADAKKGKITYKATKG
jgi:hypothetical protein